jgi:PKHD-type hydroxylase
MPIIFEPHWKSYMAITTEPIFTPKQCEMVIEKGRSLKPQKALVGAGTKGGEHDTKKRVTTISWIPFKEMPEMYQQIETQMLRVNGNHFGFDGMGITEPGQFTEYPKGGFYDWHMDSDTNFAHQPTVRKISMTILLSDPSTFSGGELEFMDKGKKINDLKQGQAIFFASFLRHRVAPVKKGIRHSLVMWFGGPPLR